ncbi:MAG: PAS domain-containing protein [Zoogloea sp.]|nr:PAS domain-containing protein [Zoogloea sp.]
MEAVPAMPAKVILGLYAVAGVLALFAGQGHGHVRRMASLRYERARAMRDAYAELDRQVSERTAVLERATIALRESTALLQTWPASTPELIFAKGRDGRITMVNPAALRALGMTKEQVLDRNETELHGESEETRRRQALDRQVLESGQPLVVEQTLATRAGLRTFLVTKSPLHDDSGQVAGLVDVATDITERKRVQTELEERLVAEHRLRGEAERASQAKDEFLAIVSHELRSPLNALKGWSHVLTGSHDPPPSLVQRAAQAIQRNVDHQARLIDDLLDTSRIISGKLVLEWRPVNLVEVVNSSLDLLRANALARRIELRVAVDDAVLMVDGDQGRLQQVAINLISNAIKFTSEEGLVEIRLRRMDSRIVLEVSDTGIGIEPDFLPHVFDRFSQADTSTSRHHMGLGIGLALVRSLVELHGGTVRVESPGPGLGASFTADLPAARTDEGGMHQEVREPPLPAAARAGQPLGGVLVLLVDDDADAREVVALALADAGAQVEAFGCGRDLLARLGRQPVPPEVPAVLLMDIAMPGEDGFAIMERLRALEGGGRRLPAIAVTAFTHLDRRRFAQVGLLDSLGKPVDIAKLVATIKALVAPPGGGERQGCPAGSDGEPVASLMKHGGIPE